MHTSGDIDPAIYIQEIKRILKAPDKEDERFRNAQLLRKADEWLSQYVPAEGSQDRLVLLHVKVVRALRGWERVVESVRVQPWRNRRVKSRALFEAGVAYMQLQEFASANRCLVEAVKLDPVVEPRVAKVRKRLEEQLGLDLYGRLSAFVYKAVKEGKATTAGHLYRSASHVYGLPSAIADEAVRVIGELATRKNRSPGQEIRTPGDVKKSSRLVITCGAGYSGTGAVTAYLRELEGLFMPFGMREVAVAKKNYGLYRLISKWQGWTSEERLVALQEVALKAILGVPCYESQAIVDRIHSRSITWNSLFLDEGLESNHVSALGDYSVSFIRDAAVADSAEELKKVCSTFLNRVLRVKGGETLLLNNCIHQTQIEMCSLLENAKVIVVVRDPRDQFVAHQTETRGKGTTVEAFIKKRMRADTAVARYLKSGLGNVKVFSFERFVSDPAARNEVKEWAGLSSFSAASEARFFFPEKSVKNVGIYRKWKREPEIRAIERELEDQLFDL